MVNTTSKNYFANPINRLKHGELSKSNWKRADYRNLQLWRKGVIKFDMDKGEYYAT